MKERLPSEIMQSTSFKVSQAVHAEGECLANAGMHA